MKRIYLLLLMIVSVSCLQQVTAQDDYYKPQDTTSRRQTERINSMPVKEDKRDNLTKIAEEPKSFEDRLRLGGSFGLRFGSVTHVNISPSVGYELTNRLVAGVGGSFMWYKYRYYDTNTIYYGGRTFLMYSVIPQLNLNAEYEALNVEKAYQKRTWIGSPLVGASYTQPIGTKLIKGVHITLLYNLNYHNQVDYSAGPAAARNISPYASPWVFRVSFL
jgi:hypothetical protein